MSSYTSFKPPGNKGGAPKPKATAGGGANKKPLQQQPAKAKNKADAKKAKEEEEEDDDDDTDDDDDDDDDDEDDVCVPLDDLIGDTTHLQSEEKVLEIRGLKLWSIKYFHADWVGREKGLVVGLHGGPAFCHNYILPLKLLANAGYTVLLYDQIGCGKSSFVKDPDATAPWLLTLEYYLEELQVVLDSWKEVSESYYLYGSSWGTIMAQEWAVRNGGDVPGLLGLLLDGALACDKLYIETQWRDRISTLPTFTQNLLRKLTDEKKFDDPLYEYLDDQISQHFTCRLLPPPDAYLESIELHNPVIYSKMQGESEFTVGGVLLGWSIVDRLHLVRCPALVLVGEFDTMTVECSQQIVDHLPHCWPLVVIPRASHCKLMEEPQLCIDQMVKFLDSVEAVRQRR